MSLERFELLELRHDDGIQTYHAREVATARPVQVHLFAEGETRDVLALMRKLVYMPDSERRRVLDRGTYQGVPYLVTDRLAGFASVREWIGRKSEPTVDEQFAKLFEPDPVFEAVEQEPLDPEPLPEPLHESYGESYSESPRESRRPKWSSILGLALGVAAAVIFLLILVAVIAFRPHQL